MSADVLAGWHRIVATKDPAGLDDLLADDVVFRSPVVHTPQVGRAITGTYLRAALATLNNASFRYVGTWTAERSAVLEFATTVDGIEINGVDILHWNEAGRITEFKVMVRPLKAIDLLHRRMGELLAGMRSAG